MVVLQPTVHPGMGPIEVLPADLHPPCWLAPGCAAQLNVGGCFAAALAERDQLPQAFAGQDFAAAGF
ncbi:MAG: hypothetical protein VKI42_01550 [Synechococcaceae cyanobacterium]|nr:hypothetical protein [Synechococcaceae cyanobacterium]